MAENQEDRNRDDLSEEASPYRLEEFRRKGKVAQSREVSGLIGLLATGSALYLLAPRLGADLMEYMRDLFRVDLSSKVDLADHTVLNNTFFASLKMIATLSLPVGVVGFIIGALGSYVQIGSIFSTEPLNPDLNRINPISGLQRFLSLKQVYDGIRLIIRASVVAAVAFFLVKLKIFESPAYLLTEPSALLHGFGRSGIAIFSSLCLVLSVFAGFDFWLQRWEYGKNVRLTKKEQKEEHKEHEGDPLIKARIRSVQREIARKRMMEAVKKADVVVTNPTHIAIAIQYDRENMSAPKVVAKGADFLAQKIKKIATDSNVPLVENVPLARTLYKAVKVGQQVPRALYQAVAEVLAFVYRIKNRKF